ncbi:fimbrial protein [Pseudomonas fluorescens]|uniref:fimbrial protein n=2 Tax=Pseudomonas TaxID=286 RepID=UPI0010C0EF25|nr:fimbrial protein [Pseudomonas fluorescens]MBD8193364.1 fimbrial protein [Pseudomonas fluorescens]MBD8228548.1 fimbrial protein [Pseudomonas fluorescens]MBD8786519.1 fimbrial protein [Pseudomonas fluorescens]MBD8818381.1 fimbrial protein [Pseudomonas fluorescens]
MKANARSWRTWFDLGSMAFMLHLAATPALAASSMDYKLQIDGQLVKPPCTPQFPATMPINLGQVSRSDLSASRSATTEVHLSFECAPGSRVILKLLPGSGQLAPQILSTSLPQLGLQILVSGIYLNLGNVSPSLDTALSMLADGTSIGLILRVKPVLLGAALPSTGAFTATLLMEMSYQ